MSKTTRKKAIDPANELASLIIDKISDEVKLLLGKNWKEIQEILTEDEEINLSLKVKITNRTPVSGEQAAVDNRISTSLSFAVKFTDSTSAPIPDPTQPDLPANEEPNLD